MAGPIAIPSSNDDLPAFLHSKSTGAKPAVLETEGALYPWVVEEAGSLLTYEQHTTDTLMAHYCHITDMLG